MQGDRNPWAVAIRSLSAEITEGTATAVAPPGQVVLLTFTEKIFRICGWSRSHDGNCGRGRIRPARRAGTTARQCRFFSTTVPPCAKKASFPGGAIHWKSCRPILDRMYGEFGGRVVPPPQTVGSRPPPAWGVWGVCTMCRWGVTLVVNPTQTRAIQIKHRNELLAFLFPN